MPDTFGLLFQPDSEGPRATVQARANVYLCLSAPAACPGREEKILLSPACRTTQELRREIDRLQKELEHLWHVGRRSFSDFEQLKKSELEQAAASFGL